MTKNRLLVVLLVLSIAANAWMAYVLVDQAMWLDDMKSLFGDLDRTVVKWDGDTLWVNEIGLAFRGDSVERVVHMTEVD